MTDRPILFSSEMVRALLDGRKTMTRRLLHTERKNRTGTISLWARVQPGDRLWVRETLQQFNREPPTAQYAATITAVVAPPGHARHIHGAAYWTYPRRVMPAIHMPRWASRITLEVTATKVERIQEISNEDIAAEGSVYGARMYFKHLWEKLNGEESWRSNPEVVALSFRVHNANIDSLKGNTP